MAEDRALSTSSASNPNARTIPTALPSRLVLFDGTCGLCDRSVRWLLDHDDDRVLRYAPLQGEAAGRLRQCWPGVFPEKMDSIVYVDTTGPEAQILTRSRALLTILAALGPRTRRFRILRWIPRPLLDLGYRFIAVVRYRIFGKYDECRIPAPEERDLFLA